MESTWVRVIADAPWLTGYGYIQDKPDECLAQIGDVVLVPSDDAQAKIREGVAELAAPN